MEYPRQIRNNCTRIFTEQFKISSFIERDIVYVIYIYTIYEERLFVFLKVK